MANDDIEFVECGSLSLQYSIEGIASASFTVYKNSAGDIDYTSYTVMDIADVEFEGVLMNLEKTPILGSDGWYTWSVSAQGVGN